MSQSAGSSSTIPLKELVKVMKAHGYLKSMTMECLISVDYDEKRQQTLVTFTAV